MRVDDRELQVLPVADRLARHAEVRSEAIHVPNRFFLILGVVQRDGTAHERLGRALRDAQVGAELVQQGETPPERIQRCIRSSLHEEQLSQLQVFAPLRGRTPNGLEHATGRLFRARVVVDSGEERGTQLIRSRICWIRLPKSLERTSRLGRVSHRVQCGHEPRVRRGRGATVTNRPAVELARFLVAPQLPIRDREVVERDSIGRVRRTRGTPPRPATALDRSSARGARTHA